MISKMIDEISNNDLPIEEQIKLLEEVKREVDYIIQKKIDDIKSQVVYYSYCKKYYKKAT